MPNAAVVVAIRMRLGDDDRCVSHADLNEDVREEQPILIVGHPGVRQLADVQPFFGKHLANHSAKQ